MKSSRYSRGCALGSLPPAAALLVALAATPAFAYTVEFCQDYADRVVKESTGTELTYGMGSTSSDPGLSAITGSGTSGGAGSLSSILEGLVEPQEQQTLWQQTFNHCMGVTH